jgi:hypothetical protein
MDLKELTPKSDVIEVDIVHPSTGEKLFNDDNTPMTITLYAPHSKEYKKIMHEQTNRRIKQANTTGKLEITSEELEDSTLHVLAKSTKSWDLTYSGEKPTLSTAKAKTVYNEVFWIKTQLDSAVEGALNFMTA